MLIQSSDILSFKTGVYALILEGEVRYVGQTTNLVGRILDHQRKGRKFDQVWWHPLRRHQLDKAERWLLKQMKPPENIVLPGDTAFYKARATSRGKLRAVSVDSLCPPNTGSTSV